MSIPDYRIFFRRCAAFFLAGVLAAGSASAQQAAPPAAAPEQAEEAKAEQPQEQPDQSEMDTVIMALCHEITILKKNEEKRMAIRKTLVREADATYNYFDTRVYEMSAVLYALDDQKIFTLAFYCKAASSLVKTYYAGPGGNRKENPFLFPGLIPAGVFIFSNAPEIFRCVSCLRKGIFRGFGK